MIEYMIEIDRIYYLNILCLNMFYPVLPVVVRHAPLSLLHAQVRSWVFTTAPLSGLWPALLSVPKMAKAFRDLCTWTLNLGSDCGYKEDLAFSKPGKPRKKRRTCLGRLKKPMHSGSNSQVFNECNEDKDPS